MKIFTATTIALTAALALPVAAQTAPARQTEAELRVNPAVVKFCEDKNASVATAKYAAATGNEVTVTCTGTMPLLTGLGGLSASTAGIIVGSVVLAAVISGGGDATSDTQTE